MRQFLILLLLICPTSSFARTSAEQHDSPQISPIAEESTQLLLVRSASWWASVGSLQRFERERGAGWLAVGPAVSVDLGRNGMGWGRGLHVAPAKGPIKREGDHRSPAGVYALETAFGSAPALPPNARGFAYLEVQSTTYCVEDQRSEHYNQFIDSTQVAPATWERWSEMSRPDGLFNWGVVVRQNSPDVKRGAGSCVFLHIWRGPNRPTAGCTALPEAQLVEVLKWLDPTRHPLLVQLPDEAFKTLESSWDLP